MTTLQYAGVELRPIPRHPSYAVGADGRVYRVVAPLRKERTWQGPRPIAAKPHPVHKHPFVQFYEHGRQTTALLATLVAEAFLGPKPQGHEIAYRDDNRANCRVDNLYYRPGHTLPKLTQAIVSRIRRAAWRGRTHKQIAARFGVSRQMVGLIVAGKMWRRRGKCGGASYQRGTPRYRLYRIWADIKTRCHNKRASSYARYGALGIRVCDEWRNDSAAFIRWGLANGYESGLTIERKDFRGHYEPDNCEFIPASRQSANTCRSVFISAWGQTKCVTDWVRDPRCTVGRHCLRTRLKKGWPPEDAISAPSKFAGRPAQRPRPPQPPRVITRHKPNTTAKLTPALVLAIYRDRSSTQRELAERYGLTPLAVGSIKRGKTWRWLTQPAEPPVRAAAGSDSK